MMVSVTYRGQKYEIAKGTPVNAFLKARGLDEDKSILGVKFCFKKVLRTSPIESDGELCTLTLDDSDGMRTYKNSVIFLVIVVFKKLFPQWEVVINHTISGGIYCTITNVTVSPETLKKVSLALEKLVQENLPIEHIAISQKEAIRHFEHIDWKDTAAHLRNQKSEEVVLCKVDGQLGFAFGALVPSTGYLSKMELTAYAGGFIIRYPRQGESNTIPPFIEQPKLFAVFREYERWQTILGLRSVSDLNKYIYEKKITEIIHVAESLHEKRIGLIADDIAKRSDTVRVILIAGPSSSGKTTFSKRLSVHLKVNGINTIPISLDDYFLDRVKTPRDEHGEFDFESIYALNLELFNEHLLQLLNGETVEVPKYDFATGKSIPSGKRIKADNKTMLIIEGIHGLNDELTPAVFQIQKYRIYVSAFTPIGLDNFNRIPTTDLRLMRRIVRDNFFRGYSAADTLSRWPLVRHGEKKWIFPHQNKADIMFNSTLIYEPAVLKFYAQPLLEKIEPGERVFEEALRLREFLSLFECMNHEPIPGTSILREFIGSSHFKY